MTRHEPARSAALFTQAQRLMPGGVNSPVRAFGSVGGVPRFISHGAGATITFASGIGRTIILASLGTRFLSQ